MLVVVVWLSTVAEAVPELADVEVKVAVAAPLLVVAEGGAIVPLVALKLTGVGGTKTLAEGIEASEL
jgi:hypothetical protein